MDRTTLMVLVAATMSAVGIVGDYFLKKASGEANPLTTPNFLLGLALYSSTAFAWVFVMQHLKLATIGGIYSVCMILLLTAMGYFIFGETLNRYEIVGILLALSSIALLSRFG